MHNDTIHRRAVATAFAEMMNSVHPGMESIAEQLAGVRSAIAMDPPYADALVVALPGLRRFREAVAGVANELDRLTNSIEENHHE